MHPFFAKHIIFHPIQLLRGQNVRKYMSRVMSDQSASIEELSVVRDRKVINLINYAYKHNSYYKERFDEIGIHPSQIKGHDDLVKLPILTKLDILNNEKRLVTNKTNQQLYARKTSGSTGMTLHFKKEARALALNDAIMYRCYAWYGIDIGDRQVRFWGVPVDLSARAREQLKDVILNRIRISAFDISTETCLKQFQRIKRFKPVYFYGYTSAIYGFCLFANKMGLDLNELGLKAVICTAEKMYPHHRELLNEVFRCPVVDEYGSTENGIIAFQCRDGNMHMMSDHLCIEFLNEKNERVKPGESGKIVITDLSAYEMPMIRYEIGDIGKYTDKTCSCGISLPLMEIVEGRKEDFIKTLDGKLVHAAYLCYTLKDDSVYEFKMYQKEIDRFLVQIVKSSLFAEGTQQKLENKLRSSLGNNVIIDFQYLDEIPRDASGKLRYFISEINKN